MDNKTRNCVKVNEGETAACEKVYRPFPAADLKYDNGHRDWRIYNPSKYLDPQWSPEKE